MATHRRTSPKFWQDPKVRGWDDREKLLAQYLMTCSHRTTEGLFWLPKAYIATDLGWGIEGVSMVLGTLVRDGFAAYDEETETVLLRKALKYQAPAGEKQIQGAINALADVPPSPLFSLLRDAALEFSPDFGAALDAALNEGQLKDHGSTIDGVSKGYRPSTPSPSLAQAPVVGASDKPKTPRAMQLPDEWEPNDSNRAKARDAGLDLDDEVAAFRDHHLAKGSAMKDWDRAFSTWLRNAVRFRAKVRPLQPVDDWANTYGKLNRPTGTET